MALYTAPFGKRIVAVVLDAAAVAVISVAAIYAANALAWQWSARWLDPFWEEPVVVQTTSELAGAPSVVKMEGGVERTTQYSRETRIYSDGAVRIFSVIEATARLPDGNVMTGRAESQIGEDRAAYWRTRATYALIGLIAFLYYGLFESSAKQATPGKQMLGLRVSGMKGQRLPAWRIWFRQVTKLATVATSGLTYLPALFTAKGQTVHDIIAGTLVVTGQSEKPSSSAPGSSAPSLSA